MASLVINVFAKRYTGFCICEYTTQCYHLFKVFEPPSMCPPFSCDYTDFYTAKLQGRQLLMCPSSEVESNKYSTVQMFWVTPLYFWRGCNSSLSFLKVFQRFSLDIICFFTHFWSSPCTWPFWDVCFLRHFLFKHFVTKRLLLKHILPPHFCWWHLWKMPRITQFDWYKIVFLHLQSKS